MAVPRFLYQRKRITPSDLIKTVELHPNADGNLSNVDQSACAEGQHLINDATARNNSTNPNDQDDVPSNSSLTVSENNSGSAFSDAAHSHKRSREVKSALLPPRKLKFKRSATLDIVGKSIIERIEDLETEAMYLHRVIGMPQLKSKRSATPDSVGKPIIERIE